MALLQITDVDRKDVLFRFNQSSVTLECHL